MTVWIALALSVFVTVITALAGRGTITANGLVGIRTRATQSSDAAWRAGHRAATPVLVGLTIVTAVAAVIVLVATRDSSSDATNTTGLWVLALVGIGIVVAAVRANSVAGVTDPDDL